MTQPLCWLQSALKMKTIIYSLCTFKDTYYLWCLCISCDPISIAYKQISNTYLFQFSSNSKINNQPLFKCTTVNLKSLRWPIYRICYPCSKCSNWLRINKTRVSKRWHQMVRQYSQYFPFKDCLVNSFRYIFILIINICSNNCACLCSCV